MNDNLSGIKIIFKDHPAKSSSNDPRRKKMCLIHKIQDL